MHVAGREVLKGMGREQNSKARTSSKSLRDRNEAYDEQLGCRGYNTHTFNLQIRLWLLRTAGSWVGAGWQE